ncbi:glycosyltransferase involved in cell wall biosynthesis [Rhizomicrobium palustre]|uniref:Glycosyltransferase involved in cell wall biosynthesis n=1 Tax=Rhizomicrobium palustre TaxID=189966 RepID=A0A846MVU6_9PROT|nr:hypothetical protein [Rhizomicrobium palustre]NIK87345.1 glycosyltransferase involved in cell wall biosynthesis [Rhizomicrobium palustre]
MAELPKIAVAYPSGDMVHADFALALAGMCLSVHPLDVTIINTKSSIVAEARNMAVENAREAGADYLLFLDSDMIFPQTTLYQLLVHQRDIVGAVYTKRVAPYDLLGTMLPDAAAPTPEGLVEMLRLPTGCLLIKMSVFDVLPRPWFRFLVDEENGGLLGEDYVFCDMARAAGYRLWADFSLSQQLGHIGQKVCRLPTVEA